MKRRPIGSKREIEPGVFRVEVSVGRDPFTGKRRRLSEVVHGSDRQAERVLQRLLIEAGATPSSDLKLETYLDDVWLPAVAPPKVRKRTHDEYKAKLRLHVKPHLGAVKLGDLEPYTLDRWKAKLAADKVSGHTALHAYRVLHTALAQAVKWRLIPSNPLDAVEPPKPDGYEPEVLDVDEANAYLDAFAGHLLEPLVTIALAAGLRRSELAALTWADVDLAAATVAVRRGAHEHVGEVWTEAPKSATSNRLVSLPTWAVAALKPYRALGPLVTENGAAIRPNRLSELYERHVKRTEGLRYVPLKNLRHTHATLALAAGVDLVVLSRRLGHSTIAVSDRYYLRPGRAADAAAAEAVDTIRRATKCGKRPKAAKMRQSTGHGEPQQDATGGSG